MSANLNQSVIFCRDLVKWSKVGQEHVQDLERILSLLLCLEEQERKQNENCPVEICSMVEEERLEQDYQCLKMLRKISKSARKVCIWPSGAREILYRYTI